MKIDAVQEIKSRLTMRDVFEKYGYSINRNGFVCCPFHQEKSPSMKVYEASFYCFGCGLNGDAISFVSKLFELDFKETLRKIDSDFCLGVYGDHTFEELRKSRYQQKMIQAKKQREERERQKFEDDFWNAFKRWAELERNKRVYAPKNEFEELHPLFVEALQKLSYQEYLVDTANARRVDK